MNFDLNNLSVENMRPVHLDQVVEIDKSSFGLHHWQKNSFLSEINNEYSLYFVAMYNNFVVGYIGSWQILDEGHITTLAVSNNYRRNGISDKLLYTLITAMIHKAIKWITLEVRVSNIPAISLYNKFGFKQMGIRKKYYQDNNEDGLILWTNNINTESYKTHLKNINKSLTITTDKLS